MSYRHERVTINQSHASCGIVELSRMSDEIEENLFTVANSFYHPAHHNPPAFVMWSNIDKPKKTTSGHNFRDLIIDKDFGEIMDTDIEINPKTGNPIRVWIWQVNHEKLKKWYQAKKLEMLEKKESVGLHE